MRQVAMKRFAWEGIAMTILLGAGMVMGQATPAAQGERKPTIWLIGDSTVRNGTLDNGATAGQWGWGHLLHYYFDESRVNIVNDAMGGTSSRSYYESPTLWKLVLPKIQKGDYVLMQFGHNDSPATLRGNGDETGEKAGARGGPAVTVHSYGWYIRQYIKEIKEKGATPIVVSLIPRNRWTGDKVNRNDADYALWAKEAAEQEKVPFIPLNTLVADQYDKLGKEKVTAEFFPPNEAVHPNWMGAKFNAERVVEGIKKLEVPLKGYLAANPKAPDEADIKPPAHGELGPEGEAVLTRRRGGNAPAPATRPQ
jgi:lysophospholipase L1-like esterase